MRQVHHVTRSLSQSPAPRRIGGLWAAVLLVVTSALVASPISAGAAVPARGDERGPYASLLDLDLLPRGEISEARALNDRDVAVGVATSGPGIAPLHAVRWNAGGDVSDLGTLPRGVSSLAADVNNRGTVVGESEDVVQGAPTTVAVRWDARGRIERLGAVPTATSSTARAVNDCGDVIGAARIADQARAVRWGRDGRATLLSLPPGADSSEAVALNQRGTAVGHSVSSSHPGGSQAVQWRRTGKVAVLPGLSPSSSSRATAINDAGVTVGTSSEATPSGPTHAVRWDSHGRVQDLGTMQGGRTSRAVAINNAGTIIGVSDGGGSDSLRAVRWDRHGRISPLGQLGPVNDTLPAPISVPVGLNDRGTVAGYAPYVAGMPYLPVVWNRRDQAHGLPILSGGDEAGITVAINARGTILGTVSASGENNHAVEWKRNPEQP